MLHTCSITITYYESWAKGMYRYRVCNDDNDCEAKKNSSTYFYFYFYPCLYIWSSSIVHGLKTKLFIKKQQLIRVFRRIPKIKIYIYIDLATCNRQPNLLTINEVSFHFIIHYEIWGGCKSSRFNFKGVKCKSKMHYLFVYSLYY